MYRANTSVPTTMMASESYILSSGLKAKYLTVTLHVGNPYIMREDCIITTTGNILVLAQVNSGVIQPKEVKIANAQYPYELYSPDGKIEIIYPKEQSISTYLSKRTLHVMADQGFRINSYSGGSVWGDAENYLEEINNELRACLNQYLITPLPPVTTKKPAISNQKIDK